MNREAKAYVSILVVILVVIWTAWGWAVGLASLGLVTLVWLITVMYVAQEFADQDAALGRADDELDEYDELRDLLERFFYTDDVNRHHLERWLDTHPRSPESATLSRNRSSLTDH